ALDPRAVVAAGMARDVLAARLPGIRVVTDPAALPATTTPPSLGHLALLVRSASSDAGTLAAVTTARVAGARVIAVRGADPRADPAAIAPLAAAPPRQVHASAAGFGPPARPGRDADYSVRSSVASLRPWVRRAAAAGMYVILDLQPGRASLLAQARRYQPLLELPGVGLARDTEWKLAPGQRPLHQIGSVSTSGVNTGIRWLAGLTARYHLPQKLLVLHQVRLSLIRD